MIQCISILNKFYYFEPSKNTEKSIVVSTKKKNLSSTAVFNIDNKHQISILEWFLKHHVTLKTGVMPADNSALPSQE